MIFNEMIRRFISPVVCLLQPSLKRTFGSSPILFKKNFSRPPTKYSKVKSVSVSDDDEGISEQLGGENLITDSLDDEYNNIIDQAFRIPSIGHQIFVIQPYIKWGPKKKRNTTPELQLAESCTLIKTLSNWSVADEVTISLESLDRKTLFGKGNLENLLERVRCSENISAVFISVDILKGVQREFLEDYFRLPVYDRYSIVIQIFREHAESREAKLQVKLAELPYVFKRVSSFKSDDYFQGKSGESFIEFHRNVLKEKEKKLKIELESLRNHRNLLRQKRKKTQIPTIAVVGYTNCGKTSLIKALTEEDAIMPKDVLFATLDVTNHAGLLPSRMKCIYVDTIGFISDIPTTLIESFVATLEDALLADVIVHVRDLSHPDEKAQAEHVMETLQQLNLSDSLVDNIITVGNKIDLIENFDESQWPGVIFTSAIKLQGLDELKEAVEEGILKVGGRRKVCMRIRPGGQEYQWLRREATICSVVADPEDENFSFVDVIVNPDIMGKFTYKFITSFSNTK